MLLPIIFLINNWRIVLFIIAQIIKHSPLPTSLVHHFKISNKYKVLFLLQIEVLKSNWGNIHIK